MDYSQCAAQVQHRADFETPEDAEKAVAVVLETLAERLSSNEVTTWRSSYRRNWAIIQKSCQLPRGGGYC